ncbi:MAG: hypothetical protein AMXMBFR23_07090 [Chloroflexota bacterium]
MVIHTDDPPPNHGSSARPMIGCTWKSRNALRNTTGAKSHHADAPRAEVEAATRGSFLSVGKTAYRITSGGPVRVAPQR